MTAAASHWAEYRGSRTGDNKRRTEEILPKAFVDATPPENQVQARTRLIGSVDKKIKNVYLDACKALKKTGMSSDERDDVLLKFGGCVLLGLARTAFQNCPASTEATVREPAVLGAGSATPQGAIVPVVVAAAAGGAVTAGNVTTVGGAAAAEGPVAGGGAASAGARAAEGTRETRSAAEPPVAGGGGAAAGARAAAGAGGTRQTPQAQGAVGAVDVLQDRRVATPIAPDAEIEAESGRDGAKGSASELGSDVDAGPPSSPPPSEAPASPPSEPEVSPCDRTAAEIEKVSPPKKPKKESAASALREYIDFRMSNEQARAAGGGASAAAWSGGAAPAGRDSGGASDGDVRAALVNMLNAYAEKARRS